MSDIGNSMLDLPSSTPYHRDGHVQVEVGSPCCITTRPSHCLQLPLCVPFAAGQASEDLSTSISSRGAAALDVAAAAACNKRRSAFTGGQKKCKRSVLLRQKTRTNRSGQAQDAVPSTPLPTTSRSLLSRSARIIFVMDPRNLLLLVRGVDTPWSLPLIVLEPSVSGWI